MTSDVKQIERVKRLGHAPFMAAGIIIERILEQRPVNTTPLDRCGRHFLDFLADFAHFSDECEPLSREAALGVYPVVYKPGVELNAEKTHAKLVAVARAMISLAAEPLRRQRKKNERMLEFCILMGRALAVTQDRLNAAD